ncbi:MAG: glucose-6-phosphate isomerase, partial [Rhodoferax sp.]|nr:glucose-6-phosphate isomerase [Rhodoferax sp.]
MTRTRCDHTPAWGQLQTAFDAEGKTFDLRQAFAEDAGRFERFSQSAPHVFADLSKNLLDAATEKLLLDLARQSGVAEHRDAMFSGEKINNTEGREVWHTLLRTPAQKNHDGSHRATELAKVHATLDAMLAYAESVRADRAITDVVNIGIGGSDLGPQMAVLALDAFANTGKRLHFVSNVDGHELAATLKHLQPHSTLFLIA